jgi:glycerol-3-phosphate O-acyltransferase/dihydroxyacetone phosphate acyltransferase
MVLEAKYIVYDLFNYFLNNTVDIFFRQIQPRGSHLIPQDGPVFFVGAPHANQFVDPLVLQRHTGRRIFYLIAKKSYDRPLVGAFAKVTHSSKYYLIFLYTLLLRKLFNSCIFVYNIFSIINSISFF